MIRVQNRLINVWILGLVAALVIPLVFDPVVGQDAMPEKGFQFIPGVIVAPDRNKAYVMNPEGGIDAVNLSDGTVLWMTKEASKPLGLKGNKLISQVEPSGTSNKLSIVALNIQERGKREVAGSMELPPGVTVSIDETLNSSFHARATPSGDEAVVSWEHTEHPIQGIPPGTILPPDEAERGMRGLREMPEAAADTTTSGTLRMDLTSGDISSLSAEPRSLAPVQPELSSVAADERIPGVPGNQFVSADGRHVLSSERIANGAVWEKYRWTIYERSTGEPVGQFKSHLSVAPFLVTDSKVIYQATPFLRREPTGLVAEPTTIRAVDLNTGQELWSKEIRDTEFRGPYPP